MGIRKSFTYNGKRHYIRAKDETDYEVKKALLIKELEEDKLIESNMLVRDWAAEWLKTYKSGSCSEKTYKDYVRRLKAYILPEIGHIKLKDVKPVHLQRIMQNVRCMSQSRIDKIYQCLGQIFTAAEQNDLIAKSPARGLQKPKGYSGTHRAITDDERAAILKVAKTHKHGLWIKLMLFCGLRTGETARVKVCHFDFEKKLLYVDGTKTENAQRTVPVPDEILEEVKALRTGETARVKVCHFDFEKKLLYVDGTKTENAQRTVPVPDEILEEVKALRKDPFDYLFTNETGRPIQPHNRGRMWKSFKKALHVQMGGSLYRGTVIPPYMVADDLVPYCLRHTFCTDLQDAGVPINVARDLMGHSDISLTSKIYTHTTDRAIEGAADLLRQYRKVAR